jgi:hypothetical protein
MTKFQVLPGPKTQAGGGSPGEGQSRTFYVSHTVKRKVVPEPLTRSNIGLAWLVASVALAVAGCAALLGVLMAWLDG